MLSVSLVTLASLTIGSFAAQVPFVALDGTTQLKPVYESVATVKDTADAPDALHMPHPPHMPPHGTPPVIDLSKYTIAQILNHSLHTPHEDEDPHRGRPHAAPLKHLAWLVNISDSEALKETLADENAQLTLLAPDDAALPNPHERHGPPPRHGPPHHGRPPHGPPHHGPPHHHGPEDDEGPSDPQTHPFHHRRMLTSLPESAASTQEEHHHHHEPTEEEKEKFRKIVSFILKYHLINGTEYTGRDLVDKSTIESSLNGTRIRVEPKLFPHPAIYFNFYAHTVGPTLKAKNGIIHLLSAPLLPPLPPLESLFLFPSVFSTLTSGVQKVHLDGVLSPWRDHLHAGEQVDEVSPVVMEVLQELVHEHHFKLPDEFTIFAPTNGAFFKLGFKINAFLFSPFGRRILKDVLAYHIVPNATVHTDYQHKASAESESTVNIPAFWGSPSVELVQAGLASFPHVHAPERKRRSLFDRLTSAFREKAIEEPTIEVAAKHFDLPTLFNDTKLPIDIYEFHKGPFGRGPLRRNIVVGEANDRGDRVKVVVPDGVAFRAAVHIVDTLLRPPFHHHGHGHEHQDSAVASEKMDPAIHMWRRLLRTEVGEGKRKCHH